MEVGAVKQAFNNEMILLKKNVNQAKIQIIHKLTRKAKTLAEKKAPEKLKDKLKRKAEAAVNEVLIMKKIKPRDIAKFIVTHKGDLKDYLNRPKVDNDKVCARLLLHKSLAEKYKVMRTRFSNVRIEDLFMSRSERLKLKNEAKEKQKNKKKQSKTVNSEGNWNVEDIKMAINNEEVTDNEFDTNSVPGSDNLIKKDEDFSEEDELVQEESKGVANNDDITTVLAESNFNESKVKDVSEKLVQSKSSTMVSNKLHKDIEISKKKSEKNVKNKTKMNDKILLRKLKKNTEEAPIVETKIVDPFFITSSGENYMSVAEPRQPDEVKEVHRQGNRKLRRAVMFGHVSKSKLRQNFRREDDSYRGTGYNKGFTNKHEQFDGNNYKKPYDSENRKDFNSNDKKANEFEKEKLHPSWEAKKRQSGILPFKGKKIVFDE